MIECKILWTVRGSVPIVSHRTDDEILNQIAEDATAQNMDVAKDEPKMLVMCGRLLNRGSGWKPFHPFTYGNVWISYEPERLAFNMSNFEGFVGVTVLSIVTFFICLVIGDNLKIALLVVAFLYATIYLLNRVRAGLKIRKYFSGIGSN